MLIQAHPQHIEHAGPSSNEGAEHPWMAPEPSQSRGRLLCVI